MSQFLLGLHYVRRGGKTAVHFNGQSSAITETVDVTYNYLDISWQIRRSLLRNSAFDLYARAGGIYSIGTGGTWEINIETVTTTGVNYASNKKEVVFYRHGAHPYYYDTQYVTPFWDISVTGGLGVVLANKINVDLGYARGVGYIFDDRDEYINQTVQAVVGIPIVLGEVETTSRSYKDSNFAKNLSLIVEAGPMLSRYRGDAVRTIIGNTLAFENRTTMTASFLAKFEFTPLYFLKSGFTYTQRGARFTSRDHSKPDQFYFNGPSTTMMLPNIGIPVLLGIQPVNFDNCKWLNLSVELGLAGNFDVSSTEEKKPFRPEQFIPFHLVQQAGANLDVRINDQFSVHTNYTGFKDATRFYGKGSDSEPANAAGCLITIGTMMKLTK
jgi:hypothetical protein